MDWTALLNSRPAWLVALVVALYLLPKILKEAAPWVPPLSRLLTAHAEREDAALHHRLNSQAAGQAQEQKIQDRLLTILQESLEKAWNDRAETYKHLEEVKAEIVLLRASLVRNGDVLAVHTASVAKLADEIGDQRPVFERIAAIGSWMVERSEMRRERGVGGDQATETG
jgi:hypothetical protein